MLSPRALARSFLRRRGLTPPVSYTDLLDACRAEGIRVVCSAYPLHGKAFCVTGWQVVIILGAAAAAAGAAWVLAHEVAHALQAEPGEGLQAVAYTGAEEYAETFAAILCGPPSQ